jgi:hypothetical protein
LLPKLAVGAQRAAPDEYPGIKQKASRQTKSVKYPHLRDASRFRGLTGLVIAGKLAV